MEVDDEGRAAVSSERQAFLAEKDIESFSRAYALDPARATYIHNPVQSSQTLLCLACSWLHDSHAYHLARVAALGLQVLAHASAQSRSAKTIMCISKSLYSGFGVPQLQEHLAETQAQVDDWLLWYMIKNMGVSMRWSKRIKRRRVKSLKRQKYTKFNT